MRHFLSFFLVSIILLSGPSVAMAQIKFKPKYIREHNRTLLDLTRQANEDGWIEFDPEKNKINPATFFESFGTALGLDSQYRMKLVKEKTDERKTTHQKYQLYYKNILVEGAEYGLHFRDGALRVAHGRIPDGLNLDISKALPEPKILEILLTKLNLLKIILTDKKPKGDLIFTSVANQYTSESYKLAYTFEVNFTRFYVDAVSGEVLKEISLVETCFDPNHHHETHSPNVHIDVHKNDATKSSGLLLGGNFTHLSNKYPGGQRQQSFETESDPGGFRLTMNNRSLETRIDVNNNNSIIDGGGNLVNLNFDDPDVTNPQNSWGGGRQAATTAHWTVWRQYEYYLNSFNVNGLNGAGQLAKISVDVPDNTNARFIPYQGNYYINIGTSNLSGRSLSTVDIVGHEYGHGLSAQLVGSSLNGNGESRALNEGFSDIFGIAMERRLIPEWDWSLGEDVGDFRIVRRMNDPANSGRPQPVTYQGTNWDFNANTSGHINSGVLSRWFFSLNTTIAFDEALKIVVYALDNYMTGSATYYDARNATLFASRDIFGNCSPQERQVVNSWLAADLSVGIFNYYCEPNCNYEAAINGPSTGTPGQTIVLQAQCNRNQGASDNACNDIQYSFNGEQESYVTSKTIQLPTNPGTYTYTVRLLKPGCYTKTSSKSVQVNGGGETCNFGNPRRVGTWNGLIVQIRSISGKNVLVTAVSGSPTDKYYPRGDNFWANFTKDAGAENFQSCLNAGGSEFSGAALPGGIYPPEGYRQGSEQDGAIYFEQNVPGSNCDFNIAASVSNANPSCGGAVSLNASCSGANCDVSYTWSGNGINQTGQAININAPSSNGSFTYTVTASRSGCSNRAATTTINVSGCGGGSGACTTFGEVCSGNDQEVRPQTINVDNQGNYALTISYKSPEKAVSTSVLVDNNPVAINFNQNSGYTTATTGTIYLSQGPHTIGLRSGSQGGYVCFNSICLGNGGSTPPQPPTSGNPSNGTYEGYFDGAECSGVYGWVWNSSYPDQAISVELLDGSTVVATFTASNFRTDLQQAGKGNGQHGFSVSLPASLKNNQAHNLSIRVAGQSYVLNNSPRTVNCPAGGRVAATGERTTDSVEALTVWPNPSEGHVQLRFMTRQGVPSVVRLIDQQGRELKSFSVMGTGDYYEQELALPASASGMVMLQVQQGRIMHSKKIIIKK